MSEYMSVMGQQPVRMAECTPTSVTFIGDADSSRFMFTYDEICVQKEKLVVEEGPNRHIFKRDPTSDRWRFYRFENEITKLIDSLLNTPCQLKILKKKVCLSSIATTSRAIILDIVDIQQNLIDESTIETLIVSDCVELTLDTYYSESTHRIVTCIRQAKYK